MSLPFMRCHGTLHHVIIRGIWLYEIVHTPSSSLALEQARGGVQRNRPKKDSIEKAQSRAEGRYKRRRLARGVKSSDKQPR